MKKRSLTLITIVSAITIILLAGSASAGSARHERLKGIAIGVGATILANAILDNNQPPVILEYSNVHVKRPPIHRSHRKGYWEVRKEWVPPTYKKVWNPGHYNRRGEWVRGTWIKIIDREGYWVKKKIWVSSRSKKHGRRF